MSSFAVEQGMTLAAAEPVDSTSGLLEVYNMLKESSTPATFKDEDETKDGYLIIGGNFNKI